MVGGRESRDMSPWCRRSTMPSGSPSKRFSRFSRSELAAGSGVRKTGSLYGHLTVAPVAERSHGASFLPFESVHVP
jgi:hypothetical protein